MTTILTIISHILIIFMFIFLNYYICNKIFSILSNFIKLNKLFFYIIYFFISFSYFFNIMFASTLSTFMNKLTLYIGIYYLAIIPYIFIFSVLYDLLKLINHSLKNKVNNKLISTFCMITFLSTIIIGFYNANTPYINTYNIESRKLTSTENVNIVLLSDIHLGDYIGNKQITKLVNKVNELNPDIILIAGDLIDSNLKPFESNEMYKELGNLKSSYGTYFALGNHDIYTKEMDKITNMLSNENIIVLRDDYTLVNNKFYIIGRNDFEIANFYNPRKNLSDITKNIDFNKPTIVIDHNPKYLYDSVNNNIDLQVSGHTHKGQMFPFNLVIKNLYDLDHGFKNIDGLNLVVSSGYGTWGPPIRLGSRSEIVQINLNGLNNNIST